MLVKQVEDKAFPLTGPGFVEPVFDLGFAVMIDQRIQSLSEMRGVSNEMLVFGQ